MRKWNVGGSSHWPASIWLPAVSVANNIVVVLSPSHHRTREKCFLPLRSGTNIVQDRLDLVSVPVASFSTGVPHMQLVPSESGWLHSREMIGVRCDSRHRPWSPTVRDFRPCILHRLALFKDKKDTRIYNIVATHCSRSCTVGTLMSRQPFTCSFPFICAHDCGLDCPAVRILPRLLRNNGDLGWGEDLCRATF